MPPERTVTTASWLLDILPELIGDPRVQVLFTTDDDSSAFDDGVLQILQTRQWSESATGEFVTEVVGDPWFDRMTASMSHRDRGTRPAGRTCCAKAGSSLGGEAISGFLGCGPDAESC